MLVLTQVSSRKTKRCGSRPACCSVRNSSRSAATSGRSCSAATSVFFERKLQGAEGVVERANADCEAQLHPQRFEREIGLLGNSRPEFGFVAAMERHGLRDRRPGRDFAGGLVAADELPDPLGTGGIL